MDKKSKLVRKKTLTVVYKESIFVNMRYHVAYQLLMLLGTFIGSLVLGCSNSDGIENKAVAFLDIEEDATPLSAELDYLPLDDSEYPYAGIPRIVIETENHQEIIDRETEIPAKLQIWGENAPESEIMDLTIKGRGNSTWTYPKKPYTIKFNKKQTFLGMPKAKKWVMLANYRDRTLIRNAVALEIARRTSPNWVPRGQFADIFLNNKFIGNYYICEKIEVNQNRLNLESNGVLLEFDKHYDEEFQFRTAIGNYPTIIKNPKEPTDEQFHNIENFVNDFVESVYNQHEYNHVDINSFVDYFIVNEIAQNSEIQSPKSFFSYIDNKGNLTAGPVWDFDYETFTVSKRGLRNIYGFLFKDLISNNLFKKQILLQWENYKNTLPFIFDYIDSLSTNLKASNEQNHLLWPITYSYGLVGDENESYETAIRMLKSSLEARIKELDMLFSLL